MQKIARWTALHVTIILLLIRSYLVAATQIIKIPDIVDYMCIGVCILLCLIQIFRRRYTEKELVKLFFTGMVILVSALFSKEYTIFYTFLMILLIGRNSVQGFFKRYYRICIVIFLSIVLVYSVELLLGLVEVSYKGSQPTFTGGFSTGNAFAFVCFWLIELKIYIEYDNIGCERIFLMCLLQFIASSLAACKTVMLLSVVNFVLLALVKKNIIPYRLLMVLVKWLFLGIGILYYYAVKIFAARSGWGYEVVYRVDDILTGRIRNAAYLYEQYGFTVIGQKIVKGEIKFDDYYQLTKATVDGIYPLLILQNGFIVFVIIFIAFMSITKRNRVSKIECCLLILFIIYGLSEMFVANGIICFPFLFLGAAIFQKRRNPPVK